MSSISLMVANFVSRHTPLTRWFGVRRAMFVRGGAQISASANICGGVVMVGSNVRVGAESWVGAGTKIISTPSASVVIGDRCDIAPDVLFVVGTHKFGSAERRAGEGNPRSIAVGRGTWVGARTTFIAGASVGSGCVVAAGSVVTSVFPANVLIGGVPAAIIRSLEPAASQGL